MIEFYIIAMARETPSRALPAGRRSSPDGELLLCRARVRSR
jgi:hypothetical protein